MPHVHKLVDIVASQLPEKFVGEIWFTILDLKKYYSQLYLDDFASKQCNVSIFGENITCTYEFLTGFYGLGDMPNELLRVMDSTIGHI